MPSGPPRIVARLRCPSRRSCGYQNLLTFSEILGRRQCIHPVAGRIGPFGKGEPSAGRDACGSPLAGSLTAALLTISLAGAHELIPAAAKSRVVASENGSVVAAPLPSTVGGVALLPATARQLEGSGRVDDYRRVARAAAGSGANP